MRVFSYLTDNSDNFQNNQFSIMCTPSISSNEGLFRVSVFMKFFITSTCICDFIPSELLQPVTGESECGTVSAEPVCSQLHSCQACAAQPKCHWHYNGQCKAANNLTLDEQQVLRNLFCCWRRFVLTRRWRITSLFTYMNGTAKTLLGACIFEWLFKHTHTKIKGQTHDKHKHTVVIWLLVVQHSVLLVWLQSLAGTLHKEHRKDSWLSTQFIKPLLSTLAKRFVWLAKTCRNGSRQFKRHWTPLDDCSLPDYVSKQQPLLLA